MQMSSSAAAGALPNAEGKDEPDAERGNEGVQAGLKAIGIRAGP